MPKAPAQNPSQSKLEPQGSAPERYEDLIQRLDEVVRQLETGELPLEESLKAFEEGVVLVDTPDELFDTAAILARYPSPPALDVAAMTTNSGAIRGFALDLADGIGLDFPTVSTATAERQPRPPCRAGFRLLPTPVAA